MSKYGLNCLKARNGIDAKALGRGIGSGCGKTCSYGHKGGKARSGRGAVTWFEGGQMPIYRRLPKRGFNSLKSKAHISCVNLGDLQKVLDAGKISIGQSLDINILKEVGLVRANASVIRLLARGELKASVNISVNYASDSAFKGIEAAGGKITII